MSRGIGDNGGPDMEPPPAPEDETKPFNKRKWAQAVFSHPDKPAGAVAMAFKLYMEMDAQGCGATVSDADFVVACGVSDRSSRSFKLWLLRNGFVEIKTRGNRGRGTEFVARIPGNALAATIAGIIEQLPAGYTGNPNPDYRQSLPAISEQLPAIPAGGDGLPAPIAGDQDPPSRARAYNKITNNINNITTSEQEDRKGESEGKTSPDEFDLADERVSSSDMDALRVFETYNELAQRVGLPTARSLTPDRKKTIKRRLKEHGGYEAWELVLTNIARSAFLQGRNPRGWRPTGLNWFLEREHFTKVIEGGYGNGAHADDPAGESLQDRYARMMADMDENSESRT